jgi:hypothetical protein
MLGESKQEARMGRKADEEWMAEIWEAVEENPGERAGFIARLLGLHR